MNFSIEIVGGTHVRLGNVDCSVFEVRPKVVSCEEPLAEGDWCADELGEVSRLLWV